MRTDQPVQPDQPVCGPFRDAGDLTARLERLPASHPSSPRYQADKPASPRLPPLDDRAYAAHTRMVEARLNEARKGGLETHVRHMVDRRQRIWTADRNDVHDQIIEDLYKEASDAPCEGEAVIAGGLGGAGKTTVLERFAGIDLSRYLVINPDRIKEELAKRGLIPEIEGLSPMERSPLVHEESSHVARRLADRAYADRRNVIWDITMSSRESVERRLNDLAAAGYREAGCVFVDIPVETSVERALTRHREGLERYRNGEGPGGRYVLPDLICAPWRSSTSVSWKIRSLSRKARSMRFIAR